MFIHAKYIVISVLVLLPFVATERAEAKRYVGRYSDRYMHSSKRYSYRRYTYYSKKQKKQQYHYVIYYETKRHKKYAYYYNPRKKKYWGRCNLATGGYSRLKASDTKETIGDIEESKFPPEGDMPPPEPDIKDEAILPPPEVLGVEPTEERQFYSNWMPHPTDKVAKICFYFFKPNKNDLGYKRQIVEFYTEGNKRGYLYYLNEETGVYWGACVSPEHKSYDPDVMVWRFKKGAPPGKDWTDLTKGDPPIPGSSDKVKMEMYPRNRFRRPPFVTE